MQIKQDSEKLSEERWRWRIWLEGDELLDVKFVVYQLHPTFARPVVRRTNRRNGFRLVATGWGTFTVGVEVHRNDGSVETHRHMLVFNQRPKVFLSHSNELPPKQLDLIWNTLERAGWQPWSPRDLEAGDVVGSLETALASSDAVVVVEGKLPSRWILREVQAARSLGKPIVMMGENWSGKQAEDSAVDISGLVEALRTRLPKAQT